jgi:hypothetical protein
LFCTPENSKYYSEVPYQKLEKDAKEIRLIKLLPGSGNRVEDIYCELIQNRPLAEVRNKFTALSYCAGSAKNTKQIFVNGKACNIFANLHHALRECRYFWNQYHPGEELLLWTDQLCIHQPNLTERSHHVGFMGDVYRAARWTLVCLAAEDLDPQWSQESLDWVLQKPSWSETGGKESQPMEPVLRLQWVGLLSILRSPWWSRAWVFQEFMLSREPIFLYRWSFISWDELDVKLERFFSSLPNSRRMDLQLSDFILQARTAREQVDRFLTRREEFTSAIVEASRDQGFKDHFHPTSDLKGLLYNSNFFEASDERDKIYAFLGLTDFPHDIVPNYSAENQMEKIFFKLTKKVILIEDSLEALKYTWCSNDQAPRSQSWVVPWTRLPSPKDDRRLVFIPDKYLPKDWRADASFEYIKATDEVALDVWGVRLPSGFARHWSLEPPNKGIEEIDEVWILYGLKVPVYLRGIHNRVHRLDSYRLIAAATFWQDRTGYRVDKMPDVFNQVDSGTLERRRICII